MAEEVYIREPGVDDCEYVGVCEHSCSMWCGAYRPRVDRDALLELADEIDRKSNDGTVNPDPMRPLATLLDLFGYARRIREALGVES